MGLVDDQLKARQKNDREALQRALGQLGVSVMGDTAAGGGMAENAIQEIFAWFKVKPVEPPSIMEDFNDRLDFMLGPTGIQRRSVKLGSNWWKYACGPMLGFTSEGNAAALLPRPLRGYSWTNHATGLWEAVDKKTVKKLAGEAICFYRPLPLRQMHVKDLFQFILETLNKGDLLVFLLAGLLASLLSAVIPLVTQLVFVTVIPMGDRANLAPVAMLSAGAVLSVSLINLCKTLSTSRITQKMRMSVENAAMGRLLHLPAQFFKEHNAGELQNRIDALSLMCDQLGETVFTGVAGVMFSIIYVFQTSVIAPALTVPAAAILLIQLAVMLAGILMHARITRKRLVITAELNGLVFRLFSGIQKIKLSGAEHRAFAKWAELYSRDAALSYNPPVFLKLLPALTGLITLGGSLILYRAAAYSGITGADFMAFSSAYGLVCGVVLSLSAAAGNLANLKPLAELAEPIMKAVPEIGGGKKMVTRMSGSVELSNVSFCYTEDAPLVLDHINLKVQQGQYVAIVGRTGCGKSTLMRLLLGFETPDSGAVYYDNRDLQTLDLHSLRRNIGVVLQNGKLFTGNIYSNIVISAPWLSLSDAWEAAELAGVAEDIRKMPMGMHTIISEGGGGISGGQRQRIMIARAIAPRPKMLMFDEATSALDNITQQIVSDSLNTLKCTRLVIAHRLSTIRHCDRILVLDQGRIAEDGNYEELLASGGLFSELVQRQTL